VTDPPGAAGPATPAEAATPAAGPGPRAAGVAPDADPWWESAVIYQVYPRSFQDGNGDGIGDLAGVTARLDHLLSLGVDAVWLSPVFRSPMRDFGYDVADYRDVDPVFGTLADLDRLVREAHDRSLRVILDYIPNHTSSDHPWFRAARASKNDPHRDWYVWRDPGPAGGAPNDMLAAFGGPAWTLDEATGQYWYHSFLPEQPDLDWRKPQVREAMLDVIRFWFDRGIDGIRIDVLWMLAKDDWPWRDGPVGPGPLSGGVPSRAALDHGDGPAILDRLRELRELADEYGDRLLVGEVYMAPERLVRYYGEHGRGIHLPFNFALVTLPWKADAIAAAITAYEGALPPGAWPDWVLGNHDQSRVATRVGPAQARVAAMLLLTLRGTPTIYYGDELGLADVPVPPDRVVDVAGRDPQRSPMPWGLGPHAGFSAVHPWLPMAPDAMTRTVAAQASDPASMLALHRRLLSIRRGSPSLLRGAWTGRAAPPDVLAFDRRAAGGPPVRVVLNLAGSPARVPIEGRWTIACSTWCDRDDELVTGEVRLRADEGVILRPAGD
jgi:alpha-glucosidase